MLYPSIDELVNKVESKYSLVVAASRRARELREGDRTQLLQPKSHKYVGMALEEIYNDYIDVESSEQAEPSEEETVQ
ncbi:DNA-directed RNA polymerase subunit omega [Paenibacillus sp. 1001270B_150601_E10]|uniref:DNA-directed RNA polymerase subunit omega n=1 Tax=Paenibacillus sp. 1001270B_150601_E10 TaxID=2787079 RepID=UPI00189D4C80|nr:DNA-directed RNA polymerase subunit omega [Paenibacillus sp. 1001270B_150601_E10]